MSFTIEDNLALILCNLIAFISALTLIVIKVRLRVWHGPNERSIFAISLAVLGFTVLSLANRFEIPREVFERLLETVLVAIAVATSYRASVHFQELRNHKAGMGHLHAPRAEGQRPTDAASRDIMRVIEEIEHLEPCPNPDCQRIRSELVVLAKGLRHRP